MYERFISSSMLTGSCCESGVSDMSEWRDSDDGDQTTTTESTEVIRRLRISFKGEQRSSYFSRCLLRKCPRFEQLVVGAHTRCQELQHGDHGGKTGEHREHGSLLFWLTKRGLR